MRKYWATGLASLLLMAGVAIAQSNTGNSSANDNNAATSTQNNSAAQNQNNNAEYSDRAKEERVHGKQSSGQVDERMQKAEQVLDQLTDVKESTIPDHILKGAKCVAIVPDMVKGGFVVGAEHGRGVATCRLPDHHWSAPAFFTVTGGTWGAQIGIEGVDLVMVFMTQEGADKLLASTFKVGGAVSAAAGPIGRQAAADTDIRANTAILTYSRAHGAFAGATLSGAEVREDRDSTIAYYGHDVSFRALLTGKVKATGAAGQFTHDMARDFRDLKEGENPNNTNAAAH